MNQKIHPKNSEDDYVIMLDTMPERDELLERSDDEEEKIECGDEIIEDVDIDKECFQFDELEMEDFNFKGLLEELLSEGTKIENIDQNDEKYLIPDHPEISSSTVKTFAIDINAVFSGYNVQESLIDDVLIEQQQEGFITLQVQSDLNDNSINLAEVPDDTPLGQLLVNFKRYTIFLFI